MGGRYAAADLYDTVCQGADIYPGLSGQGKLRCENEANEKTQPAAAGERDAV